MRWSYILLLLVALAVAAFVSLRIGDLPDRVISGSGPGGLRYAPREVMWLFPVFPLVFMGLGLFMEYLKRVAPEMVNMSGRTRPGMERERLELQSAMLAVMMLVTGTALGASAVRLWFINTGRVAPDAMFGWPTLAMTLVPIALVFVVFLRLDRRYREARA